MTSTLRYTPLRHRMLAEVDAERVGYTPPIGREMRWKVFTGPGVDSSGHESLMGMRDQGVLKFPELGDLRRRGEAKLLKLTDDGRAVLDAWNAKRGNPLTEDEEA
jgi:hypothetical protein